MYYLLDNDNLLRLKSTIKPENYIDYIDALCEKLIDENYNFVQILDVLANFNLSESADMLFYELNEMQEEILQLKDKIKELEGVK